MTNFRPVLLTRSTHAKVVAWCRKRGIKVQFHAEKTLLDSIKEPAEPKKEGK